jgi:four helix bundle protein
MLKSYKNLNVWQKSIDLVEKVYIQTTNFPQTEIYGLTSQIRRAAVAIPSNIAEGYSRQHRKEYIQFLYVAKGSTAELETQFIIARKLNYFNDEDYNSLCGLLTEIQKMLSILISKLRLNPKPSTTLSHEP